MNKIKFTVEIMKLMSLFETVTGSKLKDCIIEPTMDVFVVEPTYAGRAIGKNGVNVKKLERALNRKIKIVEFNPELMGFAQNLIYPLKARDMAESDKILSITAADSETRGHLIGRNAANLRQYEEIIKRYFDITEVKVT